MGVFPVAQYTGADCEESKMPSRENAASRRRRRANNTEKKKRVAEKEKAKEDAIAKRGPEEKGIDEILAELDKEAKEKEVKPTEEKIQQPKARIFGTLSAHPTKDLLLLFGGELCDGQNTKVYNELLVYHTSKHDWRKWTLPNVPAPRSAHQAVVSVVLCPMSLLALPGISGILGIVPYAFVNCAETVVLCPMSSLELPGMFSVSSVT